MKPFLLTAGEHYYPCPGTGDWIACFETKEKAEEQVKKLKKGYEINGILVDWYEIIDLRKWLDSYVIKY